MIRIRKLEAICLSLEMIFFMEISQTTIGGNGYNKTDSVQKTPVNVVQNGNDIPLNFISDTTKCIDDMPFGIQFGIRKKFDTPHTDYIDGESMPLVADLTGSGKPVLVALGITEGTDNPSRGRYIHIFDGQTGSRILQFDLQTLGTGYASPTEFPIRVGCYHASLSHLAIADLDGDGLGEIVVAETGPLGRVYALKPVLDTDGKIVNLTKMWDGSVGHKAPLTGLTNIAGFGYPMPYIVDLNGDSIPEVIINNKIYNGKTGDLLMAWGGEAATPTASTLAANTGLYTPARVADFYTSKSRAASVRERALIGRRPAVDLLTDDYLGVIAVEDIDGCGQMEIIAGMRVYKFQFNSTTDHTQNTYTTIEGPDSVNMPTTTGKNTFYLSDGFTSVADIDGDGKLEIIVQANVSGGYTDMRSLIVVWDWETQTIKAASHYRTIGTYGTFSLPLIGDINDKLDGYNTQTGTYDKKLPEICIVTGRLDTARTTSYSGIPLHPLSNFSNQRFNNTIPAEKDGHIIALTYDASETDISRRLKVSWAMEHNDNSNQTGATMFDFNNDGAKDICYRDVNSIRVISPKKGSLSGTTDYIRADEGENHAAILFKAPCHSRTGYEAPVIADVNLDGSANIIVTDRITGYLGGGGPTRGWISVFEYSPSTPKWAPCPPVWNQVLYNPLYINEDLTVPAHPQSKLTKYLDKNNDTIQPYNVSWTQQPIVRENSRYIPVVRIPDAVITNMYVATTSTMSLVTLLIKNVGAASISASTPITFYLNDTTGTVIATKEIGIDVFPNENVVLTSTLNGNFQGHWIAARITDDGIHFPATGYTDCNLSNNAMKSIACQGLTISILGKDSICVGTTTQLSSTMAGMWASKHPSVASVTNDGLVRGVSEGLATFTFTSTTGCVATTKSVSVDTFPIVAPITADKKIICENTETDLSCTTPNGIWTISNTNAQFSSSNTVNPVTIRGTTVGKAYITYTVGKGICQTKSTYLLKIIPTTTPTIIVGMEK